MKRWQEWTLRSQILAFMTLISIVVVSVMGSALFYSASLIIQGEVANTTTMAIEGGGQQLEMYLDQLKGISSVLATNPQIQRVFAKPADTVNGQIQDQADILQLIDALLKANPEITSIFLIGSDGKILSNETDLKMDFSGSVMEQDWYQAAMQSDMPVLTSARMQEFSMDSSSWVISLGQEIRDQQGLATGIMRIDLSYQVIQSILGQLDLGERGNAFILNDAGQVVYHQDPSTFTSEEKRLELISLLNMQTPEQNDRGLLTHVYHLANADWSLVGVASLDGVARMQHDMIIVLWILGSVLFMAALASVGLFARSVTLPVQRLQKAMDQVETDLPERETHVTGSAEIKSLSDHFQAMLNRIRELMQAVRDQEKLLHRREMETLYNQINPHFLYNTLDTIVWLAELGRMDRVVSTCKALARFFRLSLRGGSAMTTVRDELDHVRQYLLIQKERYQEKLNFKIKVDDSILEWPIPKILLQPLVENSINHGIRHLPGPGMIHIDARAEANMLVLTVTDNGPGFDPAVPVRRPTSDHNGGVGLQNLAERIRLYSGESSEAGLDIQSNPGQETTVTIRLKHKDP